MGREALRNGMPIADCSRLSPLGPRPIEQAVDHIDLHPLVDVRDGARARRG